jgi:flagellar motor protein MotB
LILAKVSNPERREKQMANNNEYWSELENEINVWPSFVDAFSSTLMVFVLIIFVRFMINIQTLETLFINTSQERFANIFSTEFSSEIQDGKVTLSKNGSLQNITFGSDFLFNEGSADLSSNGTRMLNRLSNVFKQALKEVEIGQIQVEGHTDSTPISSDLQWVYASNWELSAQRAINVCKYFIETKSGSLPQKIFSATGYSDHRPIDPQKKSRNRRIEIRLVYITKLSSLSSAKR